MSKRISKRLIFLPALVLLALAVFFLRPREDYSEETARSLSARITERIGILQGYMSSAMDCPDGEWLNLPDLPEDMTVYRYVGDSLQSWCHQFPLDNDEIFESPLLKPAAGLRLSSEPSPLAEVDTTLKFMNFGPKWYLVKGLSDGRKCRVIGGLEIKNTTDANSVNGINRRLKVPGVFSVYPLHYGDGAEVVIAGRPLMKVIRESAESAPILPESGLFSPLLYADGPVFSSLGGLLIINFAISLLFFILYINRLRLVRFFRRKGLKFYTGVFVGIVLTLLLTVFYINLSFKSLMVNSNICLELFKINEISWYTVYVYLSYAVLSSAAVLLLVLVRPYLSEVAHLRVNFLSKTSRVVIGLVCATCFVTITAVKGLDREQSRVQVWANRLAVDRNLAFELKLRAVENAIASDAFISTVALEQMDYAILLNRITENYLGRMSQDYDVGVYIFKESEGDPAVRKFLIDRITSGSPINPESRFVYSRSPQGRSQYTGRFLYYSSASGLTNLYLTIESKPEKYDIGYSAVLGSSAPGSIVLPHQYSFARYIGGKLISYNGNYAYPTVIDGRFANHVDDRIQVDGYEHFMKNVSDEELIVISRPSHEMSSYFVAGFMVALCVFFILGIIAMGRRRRNVFANNYFKSTINIVLYFSLVGTLVVMALISVLFVYRRNEANVMNLMTTKIGTIQSIAQAGCRYYKSYEDFSTQAGSQMLTEIADYTKSDITLYTPKGKVFKSTRPEVFERMIWGMRADEDAYRSIVYEKKRYFIHKEKVLGRTYYAMYAPVINGEGKTIAILCSPYTDTGIEFRNEAVFHSLLIITLFFILLLLALNITGRIVNRMFAPLLEMGRKMLSARSEGLEYIIYDREDEISTLVRAYNLMVRDLSESSKQVAQAERDKAWSEMARQVAHEIKNPLTPIKLQIQRIIRLREKGDAAWNEKFDAIAPVILESIDSLTDTANEFSTFAKLYSEEPVDIDLDRLIADQVALFDGRGGIHIQYIGMQGARIEGPKPQLTRVMVNLLANAVQAVENLQKEEADSGDPVRDGQVLVSLRLSSREGFYDVVIEDNGPGVKDENRARLFTPNFTTKSSGTGLGLAICKNILERCGGDIYYSRSFTLGGACFTFRLPRKS